MPTPRKRLVSLQDTPYYHCIARCVRRAFLCGRDPLTGFDFEHRRQWIVDRMKILSGLFAVELCAYAVMNNHYHIVIRVDVKEAESWDDYEVAQRWTRIFRRPEVVKSWLSGKKLTAYEEEMLDETLTVWRNRLQDISWFMRCLNEFIARMANKEDNCTGRFWEGRFKSQALLDERAVLSCMAYVDLNPIRAAIATTPENSDFTSIQERVRFPSQHTLYPMNDLAHEQGGLPFCHQDYLDFVDWAGKRLENQHKVSIDENIPPILQRLQLNPAHLMHYLSRTERFPVHAIGPVTRLRAMAKHMNMKFLRGVSLGMRLCPEPG